jgi:hypothetical protein
MRNTPGWVITVFATILVLAFGGGFFYLSITGTDKTQFGSYFQNLIGLGTLLLSGGAFLTSAAAQRQTNGSTIKDAVVTAQQEINDANK